jgi:lactate dehydrogenase-like 2-hydroxyacid dehydrogenase
MSEIVLVTETDFHRGESVFRSIANLQFEPAPADEHELAAAVASKSARAVVVGARRYTGLLYEALAANGRDRGGAILARFGVGHDGIDKPLAKRLGIVVTNTPGVLDISVAEHAISLMGSLARHISQLDAELHAGRFMSRQGTELHGKTLVVVGFGGIGRCVARIAHSGLGMHVVGVGTRSVAEVEKSEGRPLAEFLAKHGASLYTTDLDVALSQADVVSLHLPATAATQHIISGERLSRMRPHALLINTARGAVLNEIALYEALVACRIGGAALDVFESEPYQPVLRDKDLRTLDNVLLTPHVGSNTREANERMARACIENVSNFFAGRMDELSRVDFGD